MSTAMSLRLISHTCFVVLVSSTFAISQSWPFDKYPATAWNGKPATPRLETPLAKAHETIIRKQAAQGPNFAGHYRVVDWGCGTSCAAYVIVNERTGTVYEPPEISRGVELGVAGPEFREDSTLMVVANCPPPDVYGFKGCEWKLYRWDGVRLLLIKKKPMQQG